MSNDQSEVNETEELENNGSVCSNQFELYKARFEYAWKYFELHATQRTTMFNFFIVFSAFFIAACVTLLEKQLNWTLLALSTVGILVTIMFMFLERRNEELVHVAEAILKDLEDSMLFKGSIIRTEWPKQRKLLGTLNVRMESVPNGIFRRQAYDKKILGKTTKYSHGLWIPGVQIMLALSYLVFAVFAVMELSPYKLSL